MNTPRPVLLAEGLGVRAGDRVLLSDARLLLDGAEVVAVTGPSGSGKTLLLRALCGLLPAGTAMTGRVSAPAGRVALVPAGGGLLPHRTLAEQFAEALLPLGLDGAAARRRGGGLLERLHMADPGRRLDLFPHQVSEGNRWRVALALALAGEPRLVLADDPAAGLDPTVRARLLHLLADWARETGAGLLLAGRMVGGLNGPADRVMVLAGGRLGEAPERQDGAAAAPAPAGPPALSVRDLRVSVPLGGPGHGLTAVDGLGFDLRLGESVALLGETGSGKAMLVRALARLLPAEVERGTAGRAAWLGRDLLTVKADGLRTMRRDVQVLFPDPRTALVPTVTLGAQMARRVAALDPDLLPEERAARIPEALELAGLPAAAAGHYPSALPLEAAVAAGLACALVTRPRLLLADEPFAPLDATARDLFLHRLLLVQSRRSLALVVATEDADVACRLAHRVMVMLGGRVVEAAESATLVRDARHPFTRALLAVAEGHRPALDGDPAGYPAMPSGYPAMPSGCPLRHRCPRGRDFCSQAVPPLETVHDGHQVACHYWDAGEGHG